jgi:hypothetical protein
MPSVNQKFGNDHAAGQKTYEMREERRAAEPPNAAAWRHSANRDGNLSHI